MTTKPTVRSTIHDKGLTPYIPPSCPLWYHDPDSGSYRLDTLRALLAGVIGPPI